VVVPPEEVDAAAMSAKAARPGLLGTTKIEASGINWVVEKDAVRCPQSNASTGRG
jgi:hypothetical protein